MLPSTDLAQKLLSGIPQVTLSSVNCESASLFKGLELFNVMWELKNTGCCRYNHGINLEWK